MTPVEANNPAAEWQTARTLYPLYSALAREFVIDLPAFGDLESEGDAPSPQSIEQAKQWFLGVDRQIQVHQLRQFLQTTTLTSESALSALLRHHIGKEERTDSDRDKIDFLLVQFFSHRAPPKLDDTELDMQYVARVLHPVLADTDLTVPEWLKPLDALILEANRCPSLNTLFTSRIIERGRKIKSAAGANFFTPVAMVAFTRFSFLMRRVFFRLMHQDLNAILDGLRELEQRGVTTLDCRKAQFSAEEPVERLRMICHSWKVMFQAEYSSGQALAMLVDLRTAVDVALAKSGQGAIPVTGGTGKARAAAASSAVKAPATDAPEFEVSSGVAPWNSDDGAGK